MEINPVLALILSLVATVIWILILYVIIKGAVRQGMREHQEWLESRVVGARDLADVEAARAASAVAVAVRPSGGRLTGCG